MAVIADRTCPITREGCRTDCAWMHEFIRIGDDGYDVSSYCAVNVIANILVDVANEHGETMES